MIRAYALGQGAGTQLLILGPWTLLGGEPSGVTRDLLMSVGWAINVVVAEWIIRRSAADEARTAQWAVPYRQEAPARP